jgi:TerC family integral membrane protein
MPVPKVEYTAMLLGATGNVGGRILHLLVQSPLCKKVVVVTRRNVAELANPKVQQVIVNMDKLEEELAPNARGVDIALAAFGVGVQWITYPFAFLILFAAWRLLFGAERERKVVKGACDVCGTWIARVVRVSPALQGHDFWRREGGRLVATPLLVALVVIETTDIVFALDSIPAVLAVTRNPLIVYSSNVMAMLGLRSLYFVLSDAVYRLRYLRPGLAALLVFTASKMLASKWVDVSAAVSVAIIGGVLLATIAASVWQRTTPVPVLGHGHNAKQ